MAHPKTECFNFWDKSDRKVYLQDKLWKLFGLVVGLLGSYSGQRFEFEICDLMVINERR